MGEREKEREKVNLRKENGIERKREINIEKMGRAEGEKKEIFRNGERKREREKEEERDRGRLGRRESKNEREKKVTNIEINKE